MKAETLTGKPKRSAVAASATFKANGTKPERTKASPKKIKAAGTTIDTGPRSAGKSDEQVGNRIRAKRIEINMSQADLGARLEVSFQQVQKYEKGVNRVSGARIVELCNALGCDPNYLLGWDDTDVMDGAMPTDVIKMALRFQMIDPKLRPKVSQLIRTFAEDES